VTLLIFLLFLFCPSDLTALIKVTTPPFVIPPAPACRGSAADGSAVRPGSRTKVSAPLVPPQTRHPERSASRIYCLTEGLWRGVEGPRRCVIYPCCSELFNHRTGTGRTRHGLFLELRTKDFLASCVVSQQILLSGPGGRKAPSSMGKINAAEVLRLRATSAVSPDQAVGRCAQDDDSVGV
jgi:hypothetical protein